MSNSVGIGERSGPRGSEKIAHDDGAEELAAEDVDPLREQRR